MRFQHLSNDDITKLHETAVNAGLTAERRTLFTGVHPAFFAGLPSAGAPAAQLLTDLHSCNAMKALTDGSVPLRTWLTNARDLTVATPAEAIFVAALQKLSGAPEPPPPDRLTPRRGKLSGAEHKELLDALLDAFPTRNALARMLLIHLEKELAHFAGDGNMTDTVFEVVRTAEAAGWTSDLIRAAVAAVPRNDALRAFARKRGL